MPGSNNSKIGLNGTLKWVEWVFDPWVNPNYWFSAFKLVSSHAKTNLNQYAVKVTYRHDNNAKIQKSLRPGIKELLHFPGQINLILYSAREYEGSK